MKSKAWSVAAVIGTLALTGVAQAEDEEAAMAPEAEPMEEPQTEASPAVEESAPAEEAKDAEEKPSGKSSKEGADGVRFRFGVQAGAGPMMGKIKDFDQKYNFTYGGVDLRFGAQINDMIGVYVQPQMGIYAGKKDPAAIGPQFNAGGLVGASLGADFTFIDRLFVGAGAGFAVLNNPSGPELHFRLGGYPLMKRSDHKVRRKGLMLAADLRVHLLKDYTFIAPTFSLGYEAF